MQTAQPEQTFDKMERRAGAINFTPQ